MNKRHLHLTNVLALTGCTHRSAPSQTSDFWSLKTITEPDGLHFDGTQPQVSDKTRFHTHQYDQHSSQRDPMVSNDRETTCIPSL
jgi:hypothetical protein